ncbi:hypothetical protein VTL71DRAFT_13691 [Oculimacula yallundae]|uniref:Ubiquitin-like domain-containing protein n=1 Tax=Oculimacula yallundae TaxID=86028 RepID=A0ABR4CL61_9HELO
MSKRATSLNYHLKTELAKTSKSRFAPLRQQRIIPAKSRYEKSPTMSSLAELLAVRKESLRPYLHMMHNVPQGIVFLFSDRVSNSVEGKAQDLASHTDSTKEDFIEELRRLIAIKTFTADEDGTKIMPNDLMDEMWLALIIDTRTYAELQTALGTKLHRRYGITEPVADQEARSLRVSTMECLYKNFFGTEPLSPAYVGSPTIHPQIDPDYIEINFRRVSGSAIILHILRRSTILDVKIKLATQTTVNVAAKRLQLIAHDKEVGAILVDEKTLEDYSFVDYDTIYLIIN